MAIKKFAVIAIDQSLNSTGITATYFEDMCCRNISFYRCKFMDSDGKTTKQFRGITDIYYRIPNTVSAQTNTLGSNNDTEYQLDRTIKSVAAASCIINQLKKLFDAIPKDIPIIFCNENHIMPHNGGKTQLHNFGALVKLLGQIQRFVLLYAQSRFIQFNGVDPKTLKKFFSGNGNADKITMVKAFYDFWGGGKLLPSAEQDPLHIDDVVDSFAVTAYTYFMITQNPDIVGKLELQ